MKLDIAIAIGVGALGIAAAIQPPTAWYEVTLFYFSGIFAGFWYGLGTAVSLTNARRSYYGGRAVLFPATRGAPRFSLADLHAHSPEALRELAHPSPVPMPHVTWEDMTMKLRAGDEFCLDSPSRPAIDGKRVKCEYVADGGVIYVRFLEEAHPYQRHQCLPVSVNDLPRHLRP